MTLVVLDGYHAAGGECPGCGLAVVDTDGDCSVCGEPLSTVEDIVELALERAYRQSATLEIVRSDEARDLMQQQAPIGARLRF
jgi:peptide subunit release factor 1 (eRF1)